MAPHVHIRGLTHKEHQPPCWASSQHRDYAAFNRCEYEPWLKQAYSSSVKPFWSRPTDLYLTFDTEMIADVRQVTTDRLYDYMNQIGGIVNEDGVEERLWSTWNGSSAQQREEWCLKVREKQHRKAEEGHYCLGRDDCPELTVAWSRDPSNLDRLFRTLHFDPSQYRYHHVPHPAWDSKHNWASALPLPPSRGVRAFTEDGKIVRAHFLASFCLSLFRVVLGLPDDVHGPPRHLTVKRSSAEEEQLQHASCNLDLDPRTRHCNYCGRGETAIFKLTYCGKCKSKGRRRIYYCSLSCSRTDWKRHKLFCGLSPLEIDYAVPEAPAHSLPTAAQLANERWHNLRPRTVWGMGPEDKRDYSLLALADEDEGGPQVKPGEVTFRFDLPLFVRPYLPTLAAFRTLQSNLIICKDKSKCNDRAVRAYFIQLACALRGSPWLETADSFINQLAKLLEVKLDEVQRDVHALRERIENDRQVVDVDPLVLSGLKQMKNGTPEYVSPVSSGFSSPRSDYLSFPSFPPTAYPTDPSISSSSLSYPDEHILPSSLPLLTRLLTHPDYFWAFPAYEDFAPNPPSKPHYSYIHPSLEPDTPDLTRMLATLRRLAFSIVTSAGTDERAVGLLLHVVWVKLGICDDGIAVATDDEDTYAVEQKKGDRRHVAGHLEEMMGLETGAVDIAIEKAKKELGEEDETRTEEIKEELKVVQAAVRHFRQAYVDWQMASDTEDEEVAARGKKNKSKKKKKKKGKKRR
ncbi:hypothetical protein JCM8097_006172 [Rhodosporidiobolus ruineniae]